METHFFTDLLEHVGNFNFATPNLPKKKKTSLGPKMEESSVKGSRLLLPPFFQVSILLLPPRTDL